MSNCLITEPLFNAPDSSVADHGFGTLVSWRADKITTAHNLWAHCNVRTPYYASCGESQNINNIAYNFQIGNQYVAMQGIPFLCNTIGNYFQRGVDTIANSQYEGIWLEGRDNQYILDPEDADNSSVYVEGNIDTGYRQYHTDPELDCVKENAGWPTNQDQYLGTRFDYPPVTEMEANAARTYVLANAGAILPERDPIDTGMIEDVTNGTGRWVQDTAGDLSNTKYGGYPSWGQTDHEGADILTSNGMTAAWEASHGSNPAEVKHSEGWTNIECFIHGITPDQ